VRTGGSQPTAQELALARDGRELHLAAAATPLQGESGQAAGAVLVFDDVTPLIRTQRVAAWRDVARRLAHEIKNPLTPIQLCAERMRRHFGTAPAAARALVEECTGTIVGEVESLKALVDEFAQFARMPTPRAVPSDLNLVLTETLALYNGLFQHVRMVPRLSPAIPAVRLDVEQIRRVVINLIDNAVEALGESRGGRRELRVATLAGADHVQVVIEDSGPGVPDEWRFKVFQPFFTTKGADQHHLGMGLAIAQEVVARHGGTLDIDPAHRAGCRMRVQLPITGERP
jgi:nitrogen fixation/metabolism regulation signal transduction histidine kinase